MKNQTLFSSKKTYTKFFFAFVLASNSIGVSALAYPSSLARTGIFPFIILLFFAIVINYLTGYLLMHCAQELKVNNYFELSKAILGKYKFITDVSFLLTNFGIILSCILTLNDFMCSLF